MQVRKLIRLLSEMVEKDPSLAYKEVTVDTEWAKGCTFVKYHAVNDVHVASCVWNQETSENENWREVLVFGRY